MRQDFVVLFEWAAILVPIAIVLCGYIVASIRNTTRREERESKFRDQLAIYDTKLSNIRAEVKENKDCLTTLKLRSTDFITSANHKSESDECREDIFREIARDRNDISDIKTDIKDIKKMLVDTNSMVKQVIAMQSGEVI